MTDNKERQALTLLAELHAQVLGECPSLLNDDSGGDGNLDIEIRAALEARNVAQHSTEENYQHFLSYSSLAHTPPLQYAYYHGAGADIENLPALAAPQEKAEPVAVVGSGFALYWAGSGPIAPICERHGIKVGSKLYAAPVAAQASAYKDSAPHLHVGSSRFEGWFSEYSPARKGTKQQMRDAYAAGMGELSASQADPVAQGLTTEVRDAITRLMDEFEAARINTANVDAVRAILATPSAPSAQGGE